MGACPIAAVARLGQRVGTEGGELLGLHELVDPTAVAREPGWLLVFIGLVALKAVVVAALDALFAIPGRDWQIAIGLAQIGEFSFVVLGLGVAAGVVSAGQSSAALAAAALTIAASAVAVRLFPKRA